MYRLVMYFSYSGRTRYEATRIAKELDAELYEVREQRRRPPFAVYVFGPGQAKHRRQVYVEPFAIDMNEYDEITICCPIWNGYPAPAFNNIIRDLPAGKNISLVFTSDSGEAKARMETTRFVEMQGSHVVSYQVIKTEDLKKRDKRREKQLRAEKRADKRAQRCGHGIKYTPNDTADSALALDNRTDAASTDKD